MRALASLSLALLTILGVCSAAAAAEKQVQFQNFEMDMINAFRYSKLTAVGFAVTILGESEVFYCDSEPLADPKQQAHLKGKCTTLNGFSNQVLYFKTKKYPGDWGIPGRRPGLTGKLVMDMIFIKGDNFPKVIEVGYPVGRLHYEGDGLDDLKLVSGRGNSVLADYKEIV